MFSAVFNFRRKVNQLALLLLCSKRVSETVKAIGLKTKKKQNNPSNLFRVHFKDHPRNMLIYV